MVMRTVKLPLSLLKEIEQLRRTLNLSQPKSPDELLTRLLRLGLREMKKELSPFLKNYREGPLFLEKREP